MIFSEIFIRKPIMTSLVMMAALIFGAGAYFALPVSDLPVVDYPVITINVSYPGASPSMVASTVATPLENECMQIPGLAKIISTNTEGQSVITLTFDLSRDVDLAAPDVQAAISRAASNLPDDLPEPPTYDKDNPSDKPIMHLTVTSDTLTQGQLYDFGNTTIGQRLNMILGVSKVDVWGAKTAVRVQVDPARLASYEIGINEIADAIKTGTVIIPAGSLNGTHRTFSIEPEGQLLNAREYEKLIVAYRDNAPVYLRDVATCLDGIQDDVIRVMYYQKGADWQSACVHIAISRESGANTVALAKRIREVLKELKTEIPGAVDLNMFYDRSLQIVASVDDVRNTVFIALVLVVLVIFLFIGRISDTIIPGITLPFTIFSTFIFMLAAGFSLDNLSLMGLTLSVGFLVDDAIVVLENTVRHVESGLNPIKAAIKSMKEITGTVISTSLALVTVFIPLVFMGGVVGRNFSEFALTVVIAIMCSTVIALTLTPMMAARMLKPAGKKIAKTKVEKFTDKFVGNLRDKYAVLLKWVLKNKWASVSVWLVCIIGTIWLFSVLPKTFLPEGDSGAIEGQMQAQLGTSTDEIRRFQDEVNRIAQDDPSIERLVSVTGLQAGADQSTGLFYLILKPMGAPGRQSMQKVVRGLRKKFKELINGDVYIDAIPALQISTGGDSTATGSKYSYIMKGMDSAPLYKCAIELEEELKRTPGFVDVQNSAKLNQPQLNVKLLRDRASSLGITAHDIEYGLSLAFAQGKTTLYKTEIDQYYVVVELDKKYQRKPRNLTQLYLRSPVTKELVPLSSVVEWTEGVGPQNVPHLDRLNSATISFNIRSDVPLGNATRALQNAADNIMGPGISGELQGEALEFEEAVKSLKVLLIIAVFIMYIILGILYESYVHPATILTTLPPAAFGGLATLFLCKSELSMYAYIGLFMLLGIVSKNGIIMVDFANQNLDEGYDSDLKAIYDACLVRFRPILMTGASTIIGAVPIALGFGADGASRRPLGLIVMGGLLFAQVITLFVTPAIFLYMQELQEKCFDRFEFLRSGPARRAIDAKKETETV
ncbi:MAG: efflux RND transporter permease subunit [Candidatus Omnitrophica bacterium]|nr:efflux RND transporter permease subunit [Candidatus Omnitrophota bacterium]